MYKIIFESQMISFFYIIIDVLMLKTEGQIKSPLLQSKRDRPQPSGYVTRSGGGGGPGASFTQGDRGGGGG